MTTAEVHLWGTRIGSISYDRTRGIGGFQYSNDLIRLGVEVAPIMMPLSRTIYEFPELNRRTFHGLPGMLADSLPDKFGNAVINAWLQSQGRSAESFDPVERLCYTGRRGMGALEYIPALGPNPTSSDRIHVDEMVKFASKILSSREALSTNEREAELLAEIIKVGSSAGGARAKAVIAWNRKTGDIRSGQIETGDGYEYWLMKFDGVSNNGDKDGPDEEQYTRIEYAYYLMAKNAGIEMSDCDLLEENGRFHFMTRRFDRTDSGSKLHMQSLGALAHFDFNHPGAASYEQAVEVMRFLGIGSKSIRQFFRRMVFNIAARNQDDHVKNVSFLMDRKGKWTLAPAYDVTYSYSPDSIWVGAHQMRVNGKTDQITLDDVVKTGKRFGLRKQDIQESIEAVMSTVDTWMSFAEKARLDEKRAEAIEKAFQKF